MTTERDPITEALELLRQRRQALMAEVERLETAITALEGSATATPPESSRPDPNRLSVRAMAVALMEEGDRDWAAGEILEEYRRRGTPVHGRDPSNALRAALADAKKRGHIVSTGLGRYRAAKWITENSPSVTSNGNEPSAVEEVIR